MSIFFFFCVLEGDRDFSSRGGSSEIFDFGINFGLSKFFTMPRTISLTNFYEMSFLFSSSAWFKSAEMLIIGLFCSMSGEFSLFFSSDSIGVT